MILDFGDCWYVVLDTDRDNDFEKLEMPSFLWIDCVEIEVCLEGVHGEDWLDAFVALVVLGRGEGVSGIRPPAVLVEKIL